MSIAPIDTTPQPLPREASPEDFDYLDAGPRRVVAIHRATATAAAGRTRDEARLLAQTFLDMRPVIDDACRERERLRDLLSEACCELEENGLDATASSLRQRGGAFDDRRQLGRARAAQRRRGQ